MCVCDCVCILCHYPRHNLRITAETSTIHGVAPCSWGYWVLFAAVGPVMYAHAHTYTHIHIHLEPVGIRLRLSSETRHTHSHPHPSNTYTQNPRWAWLLTHYASVCRYLFTVAVGVWFRTRAESNEKLGIINVRRGLASCAFCACCGMCVCLCE